MCNILGYCLSRTNLLDLFSLGASFWKVYEINLESAAQLLQQVTGQIFPNVVWDGEKCLIESDTYRLVGMGCKGRTGNVNFPQL